ncbi:universal stress protein [Confluentibacter flavum]|uniref:Universal stress protein n=1 Tax=Confluentibacter flavum TaxID=1909700 RepID=A0A2N3HJH5_9FLAO|nr:universal stress protein [Confluentibacter flavum]PKQ44988.1 universal stress protein [Confluentibacter flavum]
MKKNINKPKILVLSNLKNSTINILKSTISLAKMVDGDIQFFYVKKPTEIVEKDNQLSANRAINQEHNVIENKIQNLINPISKDYGVSINYSYSFGNVKNEIDKYITEHQPDIIVLGKKQSNSLSFIGDNITAFILKKYPGIVMIADNQNYLEPNKELSLGLLNNIEPSVNKDLLEHLISYTQEPIKSFKIIKNSNTFKETDITSDKKTIEYVFEHNDNTIKNLSNYLSINNINLLYMDRGNKNSKSKKRLLKSEINEVLKNLNVSLLLTGNREYNVA